MTPGVYVAGCEPATGKSAVALGVQQLLARRVERLGVFRPVVADPEHDPLIDLLRPDFVPYEAACGVGYDEVRADEAGALEEILARYKALAAQCDGVLVVGTDYLGAGTASELAFNARVALNLGIPALLVVSGHDRTPAEVGAATSVALTTWRRWGPDVIAVVANRVRGDLLGRVAKDGDPPVYALPEVDLLMAPTVGEVADACHGTVIAGDPELLEREALHLTVAAMTLPNLMERIVDGAVLITPGDRSEVLLAAMFAHASTELPSPAAVVLTGGLRPPEKILTPLGSLGGVVPVVLTEHDTFETVSLASAREGAITRDAPRKITKALAVFETHVDGDDLLDRIHVARSAAVTPLMFEYTLLDRARALDEAHRAARGHRRARAARRRDPAAAPRGGAHAARAGRRGPGRGGPARTGPDRRPRTGPTDPELVARFAQEYATRRAHKGVTVDQARDVVSDVSYFGTLMVALGMVDGMVSGATHTTAETIRPAFELVKTRAGVSIVSSVFLMCLADRVLVYGDCAVNPHPDRRATGGHRDLLGGDRAAVRDRAARRDAVLLDGKLGSGRGRRARADGDRPRALARARAVRRGPDPVRRRRRRQRSRTPSSRAARSPGRATVFIFPDLNTGNNTYKAVQRSAGAIAIGPVLQGLNKPVNDLSRGAIVHDIVNTVAITAIQAS